MTLTTKWLEKETDHPAGGKHRIYRFPNGWGLSLINGKIMHAYPYAWEAVVLNPDQWISYETALGDEEHVFATDDETNAFIERAALVVGGAGR